MKPLKETKLGKWLKDKAPKILDTVGDVLPDRGVLGIVKNLIDRDPDLTPADRLEFEKLEKEIFELEVRDRESARLREVEVAKSGRTDWMMYFVGVFVLLLSSGVIYAVFYTTMVNSEMSHFIAGEVIGFAASVVMYYYGASYKSKATK